MDAATSTARLGNGDTMTDMEQLAKLAVACEGWRWMRGMLCLTDEDGYAARILHVGLKASTSETADSYDGGGIITRGCIREGSLPDLTDPATLGCLLALVRWVVGDTGLSCIGDGLPNGETRWCVEPSKLRSHNKWVMTATKDCWSEAEALVATLEAAGTKGLHLEPDVCLSVHKPKPLVRFNSPKIV